MPITTDKEILEEFRMEKISNGYLLIYKYHEDPNQYCDYYPTSKELIEWLSDAFIDLEE